MPAAEAMACGAPLVSSDGGALPEVVGDAGVVVPAGDAKALVSSVDMLLKDGSLRQKYSEKGVKRINEQFSWRCAAEQMTELYYQVIADGNR